MFEDIDAISKPALADEIQGLIYIPDFISREEELYLIEQADTGIWRTDLKRRVQHFGYRYDYKASRIDYSFKLGELPQWLNQISEQLCFEALFTKKPEQVIINEYLPGQGITPHIDCLPCFGEIIASLSLGSPVVMDFKRSGIVKSIQLEPRSLIALSGEARYLWTHSIPARKKDIINHTVFVRQRRLSLTFRNVILS